MQPFMHSQTIEEYAAENDSTNPAYCDKSSDSQKAACSKQVEENAKETQETQERLAQQAEEASPEWKQNWGNLTHEQAKRWTDNGFDQAKDWMDKGFSDPVAAREWQELLGFTGPENWKSIQIADIYAHKQDANLQTIEIAKKEGINVSDVGQTTAYLSLTKAGYSLDKAKYYAQQGIDADHVKAFAALHRMLRIECHDTIHNEFELVQASPFATKGRCYYIGFASVTQWVNESTALIGVPYGVALLHFNRPPQLGFFRGIYVKSSGALQYSNVFGGLRTVPSLRVIY